MLIELTDHLRCLGPHQESYLVLLTGQMVGRRVVTGHLGCPICGLEVRIRDGAADFEPSAPPPVPAPTVLDAEAVLTFLGLGGPGGWVALAGAAGALAPALSQLLPGVNLAVVNPPPETRDGGATSVLRGARLPLRSKSMRGVVLGADLADRAEWVEDAFRAVLPGLHVVVEAPAPDPAPPDAEILAAAPECWVGRKRK